MLAICLCFKDSASYLDEWLRFHVLQGFRKFYLYDNDSSDDWRSAIAPWLSSGMVDACAYPGLGVQAAIYDHCLARARGKVQWLAFLDDDEFIYTTEGTPLPRLLQEFEPYAGLAVSWMLYGSGGQDCRTDGWVIERFLHRHPHADPHVKCIVQPDRIRASRLIGHSFDTNLPHEIVDEHHRTLRDALNSAPSAERVRINHYLVKSWEEWRCRRLRPQANTGLVTPHPESDWRQWDRDWSSHYDPSAAQFAPSMRRLVPATLARGARDSSSVLEAPHCT